MNTFKSQRWKLRSAKGTRAVLERQGPTQMLVGTAAQGLSGAASLFFKVSLYVNVVFLFSLSLKQYRLDRAESVLYVGRVAVVLLVSAAVHCFDGSYNRLPAAAWQYV